MPETDQESRLRRYLAAYERLCKKYGLIVSIGSDENYVVSERFWQGFRNLDMLAAQIKELKKGGINK